MERNPDVPEEDDAAKAAAYEMAAAMRRFAHDLSNALEVIVQTSFLLSTAELQEPASEWLRMLDSGVEKALAINTELREYLKSHPKG